MKLTKQMLREMIEEEIEEGLRSNPTGSPERLHQLRVQAAQREPNQAGFIQYWMSLGKDHMNVEDLEGILSPEEYSAYAEGWNRGAASEKDFFTGLKNPPAPVGAGRPEGGQRQRFSGWNAPKQHLYNKRKIK